MSSLRFCSIKSINNLWNLSRNQNKELIVAAIGHQRNYSKETKDSCCKEISQTEGRTVEPWPKTQMWPCNFPQEPQPPNYDPYKIRAPEVVVPPLPPSSAKRTGFVHTTSDQEQASRQAYHHPNPYVGHVPQNQDNQAQEEPSKEGDAQGFLGTLKNIFGWGKKGKKEGDMSMVDAMHCGGNSDKSAAKGNTFEKPSDAIQNLFHRSHIVHPDNWKIKSLDRSQKLDNLIGQEITPRLGYHGRNKYKYAFHEPWNPLDRLTLLAQAERDEAPQNIEPICDTGKNIA